ncbi:MAG: aconitate hydratase AcnA [bacterium]|nr:aconitate hydratase AcnA [Candidatus Sumerlaeota bacterium]
MTNQCADDFACRRVLTVAGRAYEIFSIESVAARLGKPLSRLPYSLKVLLENLVRHNDGSEPSRASIEALTGWTPDAFTDTEIAFMPARVLLQDFTGVPCVADLAAMRDAMARLGGDPQRINPLQPVDLVIDHSVQVDAFASPQAMAINSALEYERNIERYQFLRWGQNAFRNFRVVPPNTGIVHQVNLEFLAPVVFVQPQGHSAPPQAYPDTLVGTDSHTTMINGLGVLGWGVGGIEAEAAMLGQPVSMLIPPVAGVKLAGRLPSGATATDLVLTLTGMLRAHGVVGKFVEYFGDGLGALGVPERAVIANMSPEYGATAGFFPVDEQTLEYLRFTGRAEEHIALVEAYCRAQGLFRDADSPEPLYSEVLTLDLGTVEPCIAGPRRPQDRVPLGAAKESFQRALAEFARGDSQRKTQTAPSVVEDDLTPHLQRKLEVRNDGETFTMSHGSVVIAAITSCTNTSNPSLLIAAGLLAKKAVERGLRTKPWVKTSLAPGSKVVTDYLRDSGLLEPLETLGFHVVGYGCTTCIGNSGPLPDPIAKAISEGELVAAAVLSGNRNFEGRINPHVRANYLASPPLVVAYALAGTMDIDTGKEPLGADSNGNPVMLADIWPSPAEINAAVGAHVKSEMFQKTYSTIFDGDERWRAISTPAASLFTWDPASTYIKAPPFIDTLNAELGIQNSDIEIRGARVLALLGHSVTTDHISPAGTIAKNSPAAKYLMTHGIEPKDFNSYGSRRGNHEVMVRGTFSNIRLRNKLAGGAEGGVTIHIPSGESMTIFDAAMRYRDEGVALIVLAGQEYGAGSSRDWAAKGPALLGVKAVLAESFERIHRSNLVGMGILPLQYEHGHTHETLDLNGFESYDIIGITSGITPRMRVAVRAGHGDGSVTEVTTFSAIVRIDTPNEAKYYRSGGILRYVFSQLRGEGNILHQSHR